MDSVLNPSSGVSSVLSLLSNFPAAVLTCVSVTSDPTWLISLLLVFGSSSRSYFGALLQLRARSDSDAVSRAVHRFKAALHSRTSITQIGPEARNPLWATGASSVGPDLILSSF